MKIKKQPQKNAITSIPLEGKSKKVRVLSPKEKAKEEGKMEYKKMRDVLKKEFNELAFKNEITACETHQSTSKLRKK